MNEGVCCYCARNTFTTPGRWSQKISTQQVIVFFSLPVYMHIHAPFIMYCSRFVHIFKHDFCWSGHRASSLNQVSCLSVLQIVSYASRTRTRESRRRRPHRGAGHNTTVPNHSMCTQTPRTTGHARATMLSIPLIYTVLP